MATPPNPKAGAANAQSFAALPTPAKAAVVVFIVAIIGAIYYFALHSPTTDSIAQARQRQTQLESEFGEAQERQREYIRLREELAAREGIDRANLRVLPEHSEMAAFLQDLNGLAERSGLAIRTVEPRPDEPGEHYTSLPVALRVSGRYHQLARFLYNVSRLERAISMQDIHLHEPRVSGEDVMLDVDLLATTFRRPPTVTDAPAPGAEPAGGT